MPDANVASILVVAKSRDDPFTSLFFQALRPDVRRHVRILEFGHDSLTTALANANAVIIMRRGLFDFGMLSACAGLLHVPRYYFLDDNFILVREEPEHYGAYWTEYTHERVRDALKGFAGVLLASRRLLEYFGQHELHPRLIEYPPIAWPGLRAKEERSTRDASGLKTGDRASIDLPHGRTEVRPYSFEAASGDSSKRARDSRQAFRIAFFGGELRRPVFAATVYPAIQRLARERSVELILAGIDADSFPPADFPIVHLPYDVRYAEALRTLASHHVDVLVHPSVPSRINPYKNANVLINARALGAAPVVSNLPPYDTLGTPPPALLVDNNEAAWYDALSLLARDHCVANGVFERVERYCDQHYSGELNAKAIQDIMASHAAPGWQARVVRRAVAGPLLGVDRAIFRVKNIGKKRALLRRALGPVRSLNARAS